MQWYLLYPAPGVQLGSSSEDIWGCERLNDQMIEICQSQRKTYTILFRSDGRPTAVQRRLGTAAEVCGLLQYYFSHKAIRIKWAGSGGWLLRSADY